MRKTKPDATPADLTGDDKIVMESSITGDRKTLVADSAIPAAMAVIYLLLAVYFKSIGGYKPVHISESATDEMLSHENTGGATTAES